MDDWSGMLSCVDRTKTDNDRDIRREPGFFTKIFMSWELNTETLFQFKEIYSDRLKNLKRAFELDTCKTIEDLSNNERVGELIGMFKRI
jgi:hypothetical protein